MKKFLLAALSVALFAGSASAEIAKETYIYNITEQQDTLRLDYYSSNCDSAAPLIIFAFGGSFRTGSRDASVYLPYFEFLTEHGYDVASIDYRTTMSSFDPSTGLIGFAIALQKAITTAVTDLYSATDYLIRNADALNIDTNRIIVSGSSAGAITALQAENLLSTGSQLATMLPGDFNYAAVISFAGAVCAAGTPKWNVEKICPMLLFHGDIDTTVPYDGIDAGGFGLYGSKFISNQLSDIDVAHELYVINQADHSVATSPMSENLWDILSFLHEFVDNHAKRVTVVNQSQPGAPKDYNTKFSLMDYINSNMPH